MMLHSTCDKAAATKQKLEESGRAARHLWACASSAKPQGCESLQWEGENEEDSVIVLSDVWLDKPETLDRLRTMFAGALLLTSSVRRIARPVLVQRL